LGGPTADARIRGVVCVIRVSARFGLTTRLAATTSADDVRSPARSCGALTFLPWVMGTLLFSLSARRDQHWARPSRTLLALALLGVSIAVVLPLSIRLGVAGGVQRVLLTLLFTWLIVVAVHLMRADKSQQQAFGLP
jgi:hypothetical protein